MTVSEKHWRHFWKLVTPFVPNRSSLGRLIRARGCKRFQRPETLTHEVGHAQNVFEDFDPLTDVLCLGSSHAALSIHPLAAKTLRFWNAGIINGDLYMDFQIYRLLRDKWPLRDGQTVLLCEDFWLPSLQAEFSADFFYSVILHLVAGMPYRSAALMGPHERLFRPYVQSRQPSASVRGYQPPTPNEDPATVLPLDERVRRHLRLASFPPTELVWQERLREAVEADGRRLILFRAPLRQDYLAALEKAANGRDVWAPIASARRGLRLLDYVGAGIPTDGWFDADHLNPVGATALTPIVEHDLAAPR